MHSIKKRLNMMVKVCFVLFVATQVCGKNLIKNPGFEVGLEGYGFQRGISLIKDKTGNDYIPPILDTNEKYEGLASLRIDNPNVNAVQMYCKEMKLEVGKTYTFSLWMKASKPSRKEIGRAHV